MALLCLSGCAELNWYQVHDHRWLQGVVVERSSDCGRGEAACATRFTGGRCRVVLTPAATMCSLLHELVHCAGWDHLRLTSDCGHEAYEQSRQDAKGVDGHGKR